MMKTTKTILSILLAAALFQEAQAQSTSLGHFGLFQATDWCGWNAATGIPFNLEHRGTQRINLLTGGVQRMTINGTASGATAGFVGIGQSFTTPTSLLHVNGTTNNTGNLFRTDGPTGSLNQWAALHE
jgi:hypothetical protein